jgi:hypothetical protein
MDCRRRKDEHASFKSYERALRHALVDGTKLVSVCGRRHEQQAIIHKTATAVAMASIASLTTPAVVP